MIIVVGIHYLTPALVPSLIAPYIDDLFAVPILGTIILVVQRLVIKRDFILPTAHVIGIGFILALVFEGILPRYSAHFTSDGWDIVLYGLGSGFYLGLMNR
ncbi:MAG: hypothetical protein ACE5D8_05380 [Fidelibacterota bacterium]